jgi:hypothetical protein
MDSNIGHTFTDRSSGLYSVTDIRWKKLKKYYVIEIIEEPKSGEPSIADIKLAISRNQFLMSISRYKELIELDIIKTIKR